MTIGAKLDNATYKLYDYGFVIGKQDPLYHFDLVVMRINETIYVNIIAQ